MFSFFKLITSTIHCYTSV